MLNIKKSINMNNLEKYLDELLIFMTDDIENNAFQLNHTQFNFSFACLENEEGEDLMKFKTIVKIQDNELIKKVLMKAINEQCIEQIQYSNEFNKIILTEKGFKKSKAIKLNRKEKKKKWIGFFLEKLILPILVSIITGFVASYITSEIQNKSIKIELENLKKDIEWIKQKR